MALNMRTPDNQNPCIMSGLFIQLRKLGDKYHMQLQQTTHTTISYATRNPGRPSGRELSLSTYFPEGTQFLYGYPSGNDSGFLNLVPPSTEELVAARVVACSGQNVSPICFAATTPQVIPMDLYHMLGISVPTDDALIMPPKISLNLTGAARNQAVKAWIKNNVKQGSLVMSQPYTDPELTQYYQIAPAKTAYLNDKYNMPDYIDAEWLPKRLRTFTSGVDLLEHTEAIPLPCVLKASSSSSGDGVHICKTTDELERAAQDFKSLHERIIVEEYIQIKENYCILFGIPHDATLPADFIGCNEQVIGTNGTFLGGRVPANKLPESARASVKYTLDVLVPRIRSMGWYGIFGLDVLVDAADRNYIIDPNFRMTGTAVYLFLKARGELKAPMTSVSAEFVGSEADFRRAVLPLAATSSNERLLKLVCLSRHNNTWRFDAAIEYTNEEQLAEHAKKILDSGINSRVLRLLREQN
jgi:hypothetical protein